MKMKKKIFKDKENLSLEDLVLWRLQEINELMPSNQIVRFPVVFSRICPIHCLTKKQAWHILKKLDKSGKIEIVPFQGVRITKEKNLQ